MTAHENENKYLFFMAKTLYNLYITLTVYLCECLRMYLVLEDYKTSIGI